MTSLLTKPKTLYQICLDYAKAIHQWIVMTNPLTRADITRHLSYTVTKEVTNTGTKHILRLSEGTSRSAGYLDLDNPDDTPLVPAFAIALRREVWIDAGVLAETLKHAVEIHASDATRSWMVGRISPSTATMSVAALGGAYEEVQGQGNLEPVKNEGHPYGTIPGSE